MATGSAKGARSGVRNGGGGLPLRRRVEAVRRLLAGEEGGALAAEYAVDPALLKGWRERFLEGGADALRTSRTDRSLRASLRERVKELGCLYAVSQVALRDDLPTEEVLRGIAALLPPAWLHPAVASARVVLDGASFATEGFADLSTKMEAEVIVDGVRRGAVEVAYAESRPTRDEGPFLREERALLDEVARQVGRVVERREEEEVRGRLENSLLHADRLATIGKLAAGVAHELNEPLAGILGFTELVLRREGLPDGVVRDLGKVRDSALHAREVVRKLLLFARQHPPRKASVDLNRLVEEGLLLLSSRCEKGGIEMERRLDPGLPLLTADPAQLHQVLVNLVVNALQAMPRGGRLLIGTSFDGTHAQLVVEDNGTGMPPEVQRLAFDPFFTTKDVGEGTGLGLSVVHGIVKAHGGAVRIESEEERGTRIEVRFPVAGPSGREGEA